MCLYVCQGHENIFRKSYRRKVDHAEKELASWMQQMVTVKRIALPWVSHIDFLF
jgi:hypothetical protein